MDQHGSPGRKGEGEGQYHVSSHEARQVQHGVAVQGEIVFDHAVGDLFGHLLLGHFMHWQALGSETGPIHRGCDFVFFSIGLKLYAGHPLH